MARLNLGIPEVKTRWRALTIVVVAGLLAFAGVWLTGSVSRLTDYQNRRIYHDLAIVTEGLASWPATVRSMASSNLLPSRLEAADPGDPGWQARAAFWHPEIGRFTIRYRLSDGSGCGLPAGAAADATAARLDNGRLLVTGQFPLGAVQAADIAAGGDARTTAAYTAWLNGDDARLQSRDAAPLVCFAASLPAAQLIKLDRAAPRFSHLLLAEGNIVKAQLARDPLAVTDLQKLPKLSPAIRALAAKNGVAADDKPPDDLRDALEPVQTRIAGVDYKMFVRPFGLDPGGNGDIAVALVPAASFRGEVLRPPAVVVAVFGLTVLLLIASLPLIKLRLIGESDAMERLELLGLAIGLLAALAILTNAVGFAIDLAARRAVADRTAAATAVTLRNQFGRELDAALVQPAAAPVAGRGCRDGLPLAALLTARGEDPVEPLLIGTTVARDRLALPAIESMFIVDDDDGRQLAGTRIVSCRFDQSHRHEVGGRLDVSARSYFRDALNGAVVGGDAAARPILRGTTLNRHGDTIALFAWNAHSIEPVRSVSDGMTKTVIAFPAYVGADATPDTPNAVAGIAVTLRSFLSPALPDGQNFVVVDLGDAGLPVQFHSNPYRAKIERFADEAHGRELARVAERLRADRDAAAPPMLFTTDYDGHPQRVAAVRLPGTDWALLVLKDGDDADRIAAQTLNWSLFAWSLFGVVAGFATWGGLVLYRRVQPRARWRLYNAVWPDQRRSDRYRQLTRWLTPWLAGLAIAALLLPALHFWVVLASVGLTIAAVVGLAQATPKPISEPLSPATQRDYAWAFVAVLIGLAVLPAAAMYRDAAVMIDRTRDAAEVTRQQEARAARDDAILLTARAYFPLLRSRIAPVIDDSGNGMVPPNWRPAADWTVTPGLVESLLRWSQPASAAVRVVEQRPRHEPQAMVAAVPGDTLRLALLDRVAIVGALLMLAAAVWLARAMIATVLTRLFGFGLPIEAMAYPVFPPRPPPGVPLPPPGTVEALGLSPKTMIVDPPLALRELLLDSGYAVDLSAASLTPLRGSAAGETEKRLHIFYNLELTLRDGTRRLAALGVLERLVATEPVRTGTEWVILLADLTPLERLLQAYERDREEIGPIDNDDKRQRLAELSRNREDIRWSRLFEEFQTYIFEALPKVSDRFAYTAEAAVVLNELAPLPEHVIDTLLPPGEKLEPVPLVPGQDRTSRIVALDAAYGPQLRRWAFGLKVPSADAAAEFLALMLIEHYQQCWASSSRAERLVLFNLAQGRAVSMAAINPLSSLIRRGLVVMDPVPRVMNRSFALFIRRAERPQRVAEWKAAAPQGSWQAALRPLLLVLPLGLVGLAYAVLDSGQPLSALLPLVAAAGPALLQTLGVIRRSGGV